MTNERTAEQLAADAVLDDPAHKPKPNDPRDEQTRDDALDDPALQEGDPE